MPKGKSTKIEPRRIFAATVFSVQILLYAVLWLQTILSHELRTGSDFIIFFTAGQIAQTEGMQSTYDLELQRKIISEQVGIDLEPEQILPYNHLPYLLPLLKFIIDNDYVSSFIRWSFFLSAFLILDTILIIRSLSDQNFSKNNRIIMAIGVLLFFPLFFSLINGQDTIFVLLGALLWRIGLSKKKHELAGLGLAITTLRPQIALMLSIPFLFRERKVWWWFVIGSSVLFCASLLIVGVEGLRELVSVLLLSAEGGDQYGFHEGDMLNLTGLLQRMVPHLGYQTIHIISWSVYVIAIIILCIFWHKSKAISTQHIGTAVILSVILAPFLHYHDLSLLLIPIFCLIDLLNTSAPAKQKTIVLLPAAISIILVFSFSRFEIIKYSIPYFVMLSLGYFIWQPEYLFQWAEKVRFTKRKPGN